ncbi:calcium/sodium antiporter [Paracoccus sp. p4-l81]|uniref:calcium/sodium antiporter n=1 Tax=unclassified Paracoccus (in: a-proteobacteria) TaxID=2688777 RepID=UPI0035BB52D0
MLVSVALVVAGLILLVVAGELLVRGAVNLSLRLGIPALIVGLTVVAFGTSAPEMIVSVAAVLGDAPGLALGNVVGSNIANILLVLGIPALISAIRTDEHDLRKSWAIMVAASVLFIALAFAGPFTWWHALILLGGLGLMVWDQIRDALAHRSAAREAEAAVEGADGHMSPMMIAALLIGGLIGLPVGAQLLVNGATDIARALGISETVIGLTLVAVGTSLPELMTSVMAALRGRADVALGNVVGSNIFNLLGIIGVAGLVGNLPVPPELLRLDLWVMLGTALLIGPFLWRGWPIGRALGAGLVALYAAYVWVLI